MTRLCSCGRNGTAALAVVAGIAVVTLYMSTISSVVTTVKGGLKEQSTTTDRQVLVTDAIAPCSFNVFKKYITDNDFYPYRGSWTWSLNNTLPHFNPQICQFNYSYSNLPKGYVPLCLAQQKIRKLLLMGDSQGMRYFNYLKHYLVKKEGFECKFLNTTITDKSMMYQCTLKRTVANQPAIELQVEHLVMYRYAMFDNKTYAFGTLPEYYFRVYLRDSFPDVILLFGNHHDFRNSRMEINRVDIDKLVGLLKETVPSKVPFIWLTTTEEFEDYRPEIWKNKTYDDGKYDYCQKIQLVNKLIFNATKSFMVQEHSNFLPFLDMQSVSQGVVKELNLDGVHFKGQWYDVIISYLLQTLCESNLIKLLG